MHYSELLSKQVIIPSTGKFNKPPYEIDPLFENS